MYFVHIKMASRMKGTNCSIRGIDSSTLYARIPRLHASAAIIAGLNIYLEMHVYLNCMHLAH
jgi:hypothetical protein